MVISHGLTSSLFPVVDSAVDVDVVGTDPSLTIIVVVFIFVRCLMNVPGTAAFSFVLVRTRTLVTLVRSRSDLLVIVFKRFVLPAIRVRLGVPPARAIL